MSKEKSTSFCPKCMAITDSVMSHGWVFHSVLKHLRCAVCACAVEREIMPPKGREEYDRALELYKLAPP